MRKSVKNDFDRETISIQNNSFFDIETDVINKIIDKVDEVCNATDVNDNTNAVNANKVDEINEVNIAIDELIDKTNEIAEATEKVIDFSDFVCFIRT